MFPHQVSQWKSIHHDCIPLCDSNTILQASFRSCSNKHRIPAFNSAMQHLRQPGHKVDHHVVNNEMNAALNSRASSRKSGRPPSKLSHQSCIAATSPNAPFARSKHIFCQSLPALMLPFRATFGTPIFPKRGSCSTSSTGQRSIFTCLPGNTSIAHSTSPPRLLVQWAAASSSTTNY